MKKDSGKQPHHMKKNGGKQPYSRPKLTVHGDLRAITAAKGGNKTDGANPKTFTPSSSP